MTNRLLDSSIVFSFDQTGFLRHSKSFDESQCQVDMTGRVVLITGANSGIGYATALELAKKGAEVHLLCRNQERGQQAEAQIKEHTGHPGVSFHQLDVSEFQSIRSFQNKWGEKPIHVLVHNAGVLPPTRTLTSDGLETTLATNLVGPFMLTRALLPCLRAVHGSRLLFVTSGGMYLNRLNVKRLFQKEGAFDGVEAYACTKRAQVVLTEQLANALKETGVVVHSMHPGWADTPAVKTSLPRFHRLTSRILRTPAQGADTLIWLAASHKAGESTGQFFFDRLAQPTHVSKRTMESADERDRLWRALCEAIDLEPDSPWA